MQIDLIRKLIEAAFDVLVSFMGSRGQRSPRAALAILCVAWLCAYGASAAIINTRAVHLRSGDEPEWEHYAALKPDGKRFDFTFNTTRNTNPGTLFIRQDDVRQDWNVEVNGKRIGRLFTMESDLIHTLTIPTGTLKDGENRLSIIPPRVNDDVFIREIVLDSRSPIPATTEATLEIRVTENGEPLPNRITITETNGALAALAVITNASRAGESPLVAARPGVAYNGGIVTLGLRAGDYIIYASRGVEYGVATQFVQLVKGDAKQLNMSLQREVATPGLVSCDTHIHTLTHSGHGDCSLDERMLTLAGEGIELPVATDHNTNINFELPAQRTGMLRWFTPVPGNEVTTPAGHFNIFPVSANAGVPDAQITDWPKLNSTLRATPGVRVVVLNHPRNIHNNFQPFAATNFNSVSGENRRGPEFQFDCMELLNSSAQQSDYMLVYRDWFALLNYGYRVTGVGSSDSHDVSRYIVGQGRTYIEAADRNISNIDVATACTNLRGGRALVSMGLLTQMTVNDRFRVGDLATNVGNTVRVRVEVCAPAWISANRVELFANGVSLRTNVISATDAKSIGVKALVEWTIPRSAHDLYLVAIATGPGVDAPFWATPKPYQPVSPGWTNRVIGVTNPIWIDADGDGQFTAARGYAKKLIEKNGLNVARLLDALSAYDEPVAIQTASLCALSNVKLSAEGRPEAAPQVRRGIDAYERSRLK